MKLIIDPEFRDLIPALSTEELCQLEVNLAKHGCIDTLVTWNKTILDGHNRYEICTRKKIPFEIHEMEFADRDSAMDWMDANQLGRRNIKPEDFTMILGRRYNRTKRQGARTDLTLAQNDTKSEPSNTAAKLAKEHGVSEATVKRAGEFADAVDGLGLQGDLKAGKLKGKKEKVVKDYKKSIGKDPETVVVDATKDEEPVKEKRLQKIKPSDGMGIYRVAKNHMEKIHKSDTQREDALKAMIKYCESKL